MPKVVGPPAPLGRLPREMKPEDEKQKAKQDPLALLLALTSGLDVMATEESLPRLNPGRQLTEPEMRSEGYGPETESATWEIGEGNPLPGMQDPLGRLAWGAVENRGLSTLRKRKPKLGIPATGLAAIAHLVLANRWRNDVKSKGRK